MSTLVIVNVTGDFLLHENTAETTCVGIY